MFVSNPRTVTWVDEPIVSLWDTDDGRLVLALTLDDDYKCLGVVLDKAIWEQMVLDNLELRTIYETGQKVVFTWPTAKETAWLPIPGTGRKWVAVEPVDSVPDDWLPGGQLFWTQMNTHLENADYDFLLSAPS